MTVDREIFAARVTALLRSMDWTQDELAQRLGVSRQSISYWENQTHAPTARLVARFTEIEKKAAAEKPRDPNAEVYRIVEAGVADFRAFLASYTGKVLAARDALEAQRLASLAPATGAIGGVVAASEAEERRQLKQSGAKAPPRESATTRRKAR